eukprot:7727246-Ditylum_brightwellii.AAC.1
MLWQIETWAKQGKVILLCDTNSRLTDKDFVPFISSSQVFDLIRGRHGTAGATDALEASGMVCFSKGITSGHK